MGNAASCKCKTGEDKEEMDLAQSRSAYGEESIGDDECEGGIIDYDDIILNSKCLISR